MNERKYEILENTEIVLSDGVTAVYRIRALRDFADVKAGDIGGYIQQESNLSQQNNCWVYDNAVVYDDASIFGDAIVRDEAIVHDDASIFGNSIVSGNSEIYGISCVTDHAKVLGYAKIYDHAVVKHSAVIDGNARIFENAVIRDNSRCTDNCLIYGNMYITGDSNIRGNTMVYGLGRIVDGNILKTTDYITISNNTDDIRYPMFKPTYTFYRGMDNIIMAHDGINPTDYYYGSIDAFINLYTINHKDDKLIKEFMAMISFVKCHFDVE